MLRSFLFFLMIMHMCLTVAGIFKVDWKDFKVIGVALAFYSNISGADSSYGFFSPDVPSQLNVEFIVSDGKGREVADTLESRAPRDIALRYGNMIRLFLNFVKDTESRRSLAASWAAEMYRRYPWAEIVEIKVQSVQLPSMHDYKAGQRITLTEVYSGRFVVSGGAKNVNNSSTNKIF